MIWWQKEIVICEIHIVNHMIWFPLEIIWSDGSAAPLPHCTGAAAAPAVAMSSTCRVGGGVYKSKEQRSLVLFRYIVTKWRTNSIKVVLLSENARTRGGVGSVQVLELIIMSANIILEDFIWMLKVLIRVMIHIIATSTHWVLNSRFFRWQQHQENIASQVKFFAEVSPRSNPFSASFENISQGNSSLANVTLIAGGRSLRWDSGHSLTEDQNLFQESLFHPGRRQRVFQGSSRGTSTLASSCSAPAANLIFTFKGSSISWRWLIHCNGWVYRPIYRPKKLYEPKILKHDMCRSCWSFSTLEM